MSAKSKPNVDIDVTNYLSAQLFLADYYKKRKELDPEFSYGEWATEIGFKNRSFLRLIATGQRAITEISKKIFLANFDFDEIEHQYFGHLVDRANAKTEQDIKTHSEALASLLRLRFQRFEVRNHLDFLMSPEIPSLQVLLSYEDILRTSENLAKLLNTSLESVSKWLTVLADLKMAEMKEIDGVTEWVSTSQSFRIPDLPGDVAVKYFHESSLKKAIHSLDLPKESRRFRSLLFPLNEQQFGDVWQKLNEFATSLLKQYDGLPFEDRRLYQINVNMVPLTEPVKQEDSEA